MPAARARRRRVLAGLGALAFMAIQTWLSSRPMPRLSVLAFSASDKVVHGTAWALLGGLLLLAAARPTARTVVLAVAVAIAFGVSDELHQSRVPGRDASALDLLADALGATVGAALSAWYSRRRWPSSRASAASAPASPPTSSSPITSP